MSVRKSARNAKKNRNGCEQKALTGDERRSTQIEMIHRLLFPVDYYQRARDTGTGKPILIRGS